MAIVVRQATDDDVPALARLRRRSHEERHEVDDDGEDAYVRDFVAWWSPRADGFRAAVAVDGDRLVGMGFLAVVDRVPVPGDVDRHHGDIQSMYVVPEHRDAGIGGRIPTRSCPPCGPFPPRIGPGKGHPVGKKR